MTPEQREEWGLASENPDPKIFPHIEDRIRLVISTIKSRAIIANGGMIKTFSISPVTVIMYPESKNP